MKAEKTMDKYCLLACFPWFAQPTIHRTQDHQPRHATTHSELDPFTSIINQSDGGNFSTTFSPSTELHAWPHLPIPQDALTQTLAYIL